MSVSFDVKSNNLCDRCVTMLESYDKFISKAQLIQDKLRGFMSSKVEQKQKIEDAEVGGRSRVKEEIKLNDDINDQENPGDSNDEDSDDKPLMTKTKPSPSTTSDIQCDICKIKLKSRKSLLIHRRRHVDPYKTISKEEFSICDICGSTFKSINFHKHRKSCEMRSSGDFKCPECSEKFTDYKIFKNHKRLHRVHEKFSKTEKASCDICGKKFHAGFKMKRHMLTHMAIKTYGCPMCQVRYNSSWNMLTHLKKFHEENFPAVRDFRCTLCANTKFNRVCLLREHMETIHGYFNIPS